MCRNPLNTVNTSGTKSSDFHQQHHAFLCMWGFREALNKRFDTYHKPFNNTQHLVNPKDSPPGEKMSVD